MTRYVVYVTPTAWEEMRSLPGSVRQRVRKAVDALAYDPHPPRSVRLDVPDSPGEVRRLRLDRWRIVYTVDERTRTLDVLAVHRRPPYDCGDLASLIKGV